jgi:dUTP pyrophosphatase
MTETLRYARLTPDAKPPYRKHSTDAGVDVYSAEKCIVWPFSARVIRTGLTFECPPGFMLLAKPKGASKHLVGAGVGDALYQGEYKIRVVNFTPWPMVIQKGAPIAQIIQVPIAAFALEESSPDSIHHLPSERGSSGGIHANR